MRKRSTSFTRAFICAATLISAVSTQPTMARTTEGDLARETPTVDPACGGQATLVIDAYAQEPQSTRRALKTFAAANRLLPLFRDKPQQVLEGGIEGNHLIAAYKASCQTAIRAAMESPAWRKLVASLAPNPAQRITVFTPDPDNITSSRQTPSCKKPAYFVLKGNVSNPKKYFEYLGALVRSGLLQRHGYHREVVMPGREVRLSWQGNSFGQGEFFEILRFPCASELHRFWNSPEYRAIVPLRHGAVRVDAWHYQS